MLRRAVGMLVSAGTAIAIGGCAPDADGPEPFRAVRTDSAGVEIVLNPVRSAAVPVFAVLDSVADLRLGSVGGRPEEQFATVTDVEALSDGALAVLDGQVGEIRVFRSDGSHRMSVGSRGQGPGELQGPIEVGLLSGDTLAVYDAVRRRITRFAPDGALGRITTLQDTRSQIVAASFLPDGRMLGQSRWLAPGGGSVPGPEPTLVRETAVLTLFAADGQVDDTIDVVPGPETIGRIEMGQGRIEVFKRPAAFGRDNVFAVHPDGIWSSPNDRFDLRLYDPASGRLLRVVRAPGLERPATDRMARAIRDSALAEVETAEDRSWIEDWYSLSPRVETVPAFDLLVVDDDARLWVRAWSPPFESDTRWWVFAGRGDLLGVVDVPNRMAVHAIGCGWIVGVEPGDMGVSQVVRYPMRGADPC